MRSFQPSLKGIDIPRPEPNSGVTFYDLKHVESVDFSIEASDVIGNVIEAHSTPDDSSEVNWTDVDLPDGVHDRAGFLQLGMSFIREYCMSPEQQLKSRWSMPTKKRNKQEKAPSVFILPDAVKTDDALLWLGRAYTGIYGSGFAGIDMNVATASNRTTDMAAAETTMAAESKKLKFGVIIEETDASIYRYLRAERLRDSLRKLDVPLLSLVTLVQHRQKQPENVRDTHPQEPATTSILV